MADLTFGEIATQYAHDVVEGRIPSSGLHLLACQRHLSDLARADTDDFPYVFNIELTAADGVKYFPAERVCKFAQNMPHIKGDWAARGQRIKLVPWQIFILASIFGWVHRVTFKRRFRIADLYVPRKNAKSTLASVIGLYMLAANGEFGAEVYSGATSQDQALEVFRPASLMAKATPKFLQIYGVTVNASNISVVDTNSKFEPVIGKPGDGASPSCAIIDEYHEHKTSELYDTMLTGMGARSQPLLLVITTAGADIGGPCYQHQADMQKILEGTVKNEQRFGIIFGIDKDDDWSKEDVLRKANPNFGISIDEEFLKLQQRDATVDPRKQNVFKTKHLNVWVAAASPWLNLYNLQKAGNAELTLESMRGQMCTIGLDLASKQDIATVVWLFRTLNDAGLDYYRVVTRNYVPEAMLEKPENEHYQGWVNSGHLIATPGNMISLSQIEGDVLDSTAIIVIGEIAKDPWGGQQMGANLQEKGLEVVDIPQIVKYMSDPMKEIQALVDAGRFEHDDNPCTVWQFSNVEVFEDRKENIFPRKSRAQNKIDAAVATIVAMNRAMVGNNGGSIGSDYELMVV